MRVVADNDVRGQAAILLTALGDCTMSNLQFRPLGQQVRPALADRFNLGCQEVIDLLRGAANEGVGVEGGGEIHAGEGGVAFQAIEQVVGPAVLFDAGRGLDAVEADQIGRAHV